MIKHLILGSKGQIGSYVVQAALDRGDEVIEWDLVDGYKFDLRQEENNRELCEVMDGVDFVHFLAFDVGGSQYLAKKQDSIEYIQNNMDIMANVFWALKRTGKPFYFASSQMENMPCTYGRLKALGEVYTKELGGFIVRFWNVYGYESDPEKTHVITDFIKSALKDKQILCRTDGTETRNFVHGEDAAASLLHIVDNPKRYNPSKPIPIFGQECSIQYIANSIALLIPGTTVYTTNKKDTTQTHTNNVNDPQYQGHIVTRYHPGNGSVNTTESGAPQGKFYNIGDGLKDILKRIEKE